MLFNLTPLRQVLSGRPEIVAPSLASGSPLNEIDRIVCLLAVRLAQYRNLQRRLKPGAN